MERRKGGREADREGGKEEVKERERKEKSKGL